MSLQVQKFSLAAAAAMGIAYVLCGIFVALFPEVATNLMSWLTHIVNLEPRGITWGAFMGGLLQAVIYTYLFALVFAWLHNKFVK